MASDDSADVVVVGTGVVGCLIAQQALDAGLSVLMLEAGPRVGAVVSSQRARRQSRRSADRANPRRQCWKRAQAFFANRQSAGASQQLLAQPALAREEETDQGVAGFLKHAPKHTFTLAYTYR